MFYILWVNCDLVWIDGVKIKYNTIQYNTNHYFTSDINLNPTKFMSEVYCQSTTQANYMHQNISSYNIFALLWTFNLMQFETHLKSIPTIISIMKLPFQSS